MSELEESAEAVEFRACATVTVKAKAHDVWALWADVNGWRNWDQGIEAVELHGNNFKAGNGFSLTPRGGEPMKVTIVTATQGEEFSDETELPFGVIRTAHRVEPLAGFVTITHEVVATIAGEMAGMFRHEIWPGLQRGLSEALNNAAEILDAD